MSAEANVLTVCGHPPALSLLLITRAEYTQSLFLLSMLNARYQSGSLKPQTDSSAPPYGTFIPSTFNYSAHDLHIQEHPFEALTNDGFLLMTRAFPSLRRMPRSSLPIGLVHPIHHPTNPLSPILIPRPLSHPLLHAHLKWLFI